MSPKEFTWPRTFPGSGRGRSLLRAHGIPPQERRLLKGSGLKLIDATCPRVTRVQALIRYHTHKGYLAVIVGEPDHPEVIGLKGHGNGNSEIFKQAYFVANREWSPVEDELMRPDYELALEDEANVFAWPPIYNTLTKFIKSYDALQQRLAERKQALPVRQ